MPFKPTTKTVDDFLLGSHTDYVNPWVTVHDEVDYTTPVALSFPIMKLVTEVGSLKEVIDMFKLPGLSMSYDVEFDKFHSWTASSSVDIYKYPLHHIQSELYAELEATKQAIKERELGQTVTEPSKASDTVKQQEEDTNAQVNHERSTDLAVETSHTTSVEPQPLSSNSEDNSAIDLDDDSGVSFEEGGHRTKTGKVYKFSIAGVKPEFLDAINKLPDGLDSIIITANLESFTYNRKVDFSSLENFVKIGH